MRSIGYKGDFFFLKAIIAAGGIPNFLYRLPFYFFLAYALCYGFFLFVVFVFVSAFVFLSMLFSLELCFSDIFLSSRQRTGLATAYITGYG